MVVSNTCSRVVIIIISFYMISLDVFTQKIHSLTSYNILVKPLDKFINSELNYIKTTVLTVILNPTKVLSDSLCT